MSNNFNNLIDSLHKNNTNIYIIHGIGTDIGKTHTICRLIKTLNEKIKQNFVIKPLVSGINFDDIEKSDNFKLLAAAFGRNPSFDEVKQISRYIFTEPLSPDIASWAQGINIDFEEIILFCKEWIGCARQENKRLFIETAGGVCSPCTNTHTMADISKALLATDVENILIATQYLGAISHTISALQILKFDKLVINRNDEHFSQSIINHLPYEIDVYSI